MNSILKGIAFKKESFRFKLDEVNALTAAVSTANDLYVTGYATYFEVITARKGVLDAELQRTGIKNQLFQSIVDLYHALGGGWE